MDEVNPFSNVSPASNPFSGLTPEQSPSVMSPDQVDHTARLAAMATLSPTADSMVSDYQSAVQSYRDTISTAGDLTVRNQVAAKQSQDQVNELAKVVQNASAFDPTGDLARGATMAAQKIIQETDDSRSKYALEMEAVKNAQHMAAAGDTTQAQLILDNLEHGGPRDVLTELNTKQLILQREIEKAGLNVHNQSYLADAADFMLGFLPLYTSTGQVGNVDLDGAAKHWYDSLFSGNRKFNEASALWSMPMKDFVNFAPSLIDNIKNNSTFLGYVNNSERLSLLSEMDKTTDPTAQNAFNALDNIGLVAALKPLKAAASVPMMLLKNGARQEVTGAVAQAAREIMTEGAANAGKTVGVSAEAVEGNMLPKALNPTTEGLPTVSLSTDVSQALDRSQALIDELPKIMAPNRLTPGEQQEAISKFVQKITEQISNPIKDISYPKLRLSTGSEVQQVELTIGRGKGGGFVSEKNATRYLDSLGYKGEATVDESGQWFAKVKLTVPENGFYTQAVKPKTWSVGWMNKLQSAKNIGDDMLANAAQMSGNTQNKILKSFVTPVANKIHALGNEARGQLQQVLMAANSEGHWWNTDELVNLYKRSFNRVPTSADFEAYQGVIDANDLEFVLRNDDLWKNKALSGMKTVSFESKIASVDRGNAQVHAELSEVPKERVYDASSGIHYNENNPLTPEIFNKLKSQGYRLVNTENAVDLADGTTVKSFLVKDKDLLIEDLRRDQLGYRQGGHRIYTGKHFVKQADRGVQSDTMKSFLRNPNVFIAADTKAQASFWAEEMEKARQILKSAGTGGRKFIENNSADLAARIERETRLGSHAGLPSGEDFVRGIQDKTYSLDDPFEALYDREMPSAYRNADPNTLDFATPREAGQDGFLRSVGRMYYGGKGAQLKDFNGELAKTLDPFKTLDRSLMNVAKLSSFSDYKTAAVKRWIETFKGEIDRYDPSMSDFRQFEAAAMKSDTPQRIREMAERQREIIRRNLGWQSDADRDKTQVAKRLADWISGDDPSVTWRQSLARNTENWWETKNPIQAMRGFAFDAHLGFFNPAQLFLQTGTLMTSLLMNGLQDSMHAIYTIRPLRLFLTKSGSEEMLDHFISKGLHTDAGFNSPAEFKAFMNSAKNSGFFDFGNTHQLINAYGVNSELSDFRNGIQKVREAGRLFFNEGETLNRLAAYRFAWRDVVNGKFPRADFASPEFHARVAGRSEDWAFQMSQQSQAAWQSGLASIPTQFWAYNARMMELAFGKTFTREQRAKLIFSQLFLTGAAGTPVTYELMNQYQKASGDTKTTDLNTWQGMASRGFLDSLVYHLSGADTTLGERIGTGNFIPETIRGLFGLSAYGEKSTADVLGGPTLATAQHLGKTLHDVLRWELAESGGDTGVGITRDVVTGLASNITTLSNINKAYLIMKYGELRSAGGTVMDDNVPTIDAFGQALGFAPGSGLNSAVMSGFVKDQGEQITDLAKQITSLRQKAFLEPDRMEDYIGQINLLMKMYPSYIRGQALAKAHKSTPDSLYDNIAKRYTAEQSYANEAGE